MSEFYHNDVIHAEVQECFPLLISWLEDMRFEWHSGEACRHLIHPRNLYHLTHCPLPWDIVEVGFSHLPVYPADASPQEREQREVTLWFIRQREVLGRAKLLHLVLWSQDEAEVLAFLRAHISALLADDCVELGPAIGIDCYGSEVAWIGVDDIPF